MKSCLRACLISATLALASAASAPKAPFSQTQESGVDNYSFDLLTEKMLPREGLVTAFQKLAKLDGGENTMLSSHPSSANRAENMQKRIDKKP